MAKEIIIEKNLDQCTPLSIHDSRLRVDWYNAGEGISGDYNPEDKDDVNLLRFDVYCKRTNNDNWEEVEDASYCTLVAAEASDAELERILRIIFNRYDDVIDDYIKYGTSVKKLGEELSWMQYIPEK